MKNLKKTFRWFGPDFGVSLAEIRQLGVQGIVAACQEVPLGEIWPKDTIGALKAQIENHGMEWSVVESVNVHTAIKYGLKERDLYISNYIETLKNLAAHGIYNVCYNFMQLIDWTRTDLDYILPTGASALRYSPISAAAFDLFILEREGAQESYSKEEYLEAKTYFEALSDSEKKNLKAAILAGMPGSRKEIDLSEFKKNHTTVLGIKKETLQENLSYFLNAVIPEAEKLGVRMAIHPDDPPFSVFGVPRIVSNYNDIKFLLECCPSPSNGLTFCSGSLGASETNDLVKIIEDFGDKIHFIHLRNVSRDQDGSFYEADHLSGSVPMQKVMKAIVQQQQKRHMTQNGVVDIPMRPDHGHVLLDDKKRQQEFYSGYSLIGRAMGLAQLSGLEMGVRASLDV
ncbi:mannonate dehydratase [Maribacter cobaltidurans]|uniref:Mannonate dehydratase n=1 Tax=Maribacter cobaltidurans TaxID=1178778 RepID=A0A223V3E7_9FLAO|nr:mannonate dehydratase [Maribacter cobaltidurans]ASV29911.1 mannonate dehydratase [Maribacter cobaltidurans]GGD88739.1 mannonate dehydratase [Maribacter cobaltidurans]